MVVGGRLDFAEIKLISPSLVDTRLKLGWADLGKIYPELYMGGAIFVINVSKILRFENDQISPLQNKILSKKTISNIY